MKINDLIVGILVRIDKLREQYRKLWRSDKCDVVFLYYISLLDEVENNINKLCEK